MPNPLPQAFYLPVASIKVAPERQRKEFEDAALLELADSIRQFGLFHALQVRQDGITLVTGERRLRAITQHLLPLGRTFSYGGEPVPAGHVPVIMVGSSDPLAVEEIELDENIKRKDLTWQEHASAVARLHSLRAAQKASTADASEPPPVQTVADTAKEVYGEDANNFRKDEVRQKILVAAHLDRPEVAKAPSLKDAFKALKRLEEGERNKALAIAVGETFHAGLHQAHNINCLEWMARPEAEGKFDVILTDPPYGMGAHLFGDGAGRLEGIDHSYDDSYESWQPLMAAWTKLSWKVAKPQAHAYVFCDIDRFHELKAMMEDAGWYVFRTPLINYKADSGRVPLPDLGPRRQWECLLYAIKGKKQTTALYSDVITTKADEQMSHGAQKPVTLYQDLLQRSVRPGDWVLDSFAGTGTIFPAAHSFKCVAVGLEQNPTYYGLCLKRMEDLSRQKELV